ncbi:MAG: site-2 protease family protein [Cytophagales bacterium]|nr:site-2 protease family protein [Armatimonadota bacterium]
MIEILQQRLGPLLSAAALKTLPWQLWVLLLLAILLSTVAHVFGHAWMADRLGDPNPRSKGRVTLNPLAHLDPLGTLMMAATTLIGFPVGWGRSVRTNPEAYRVGPRFGLALVAAAGPLSNLLFAVLLSPVARWMIAELQRRRGDVGETFLWLLMLVTATMLVNLSLFAFNLVPVAPLDATHVASSALPPPLGAAYRTFMERYGSYVFIALMYTGALPAVISPLILRLFMILVGL